MSEWQPIETAPKGKNILVYGEGFPIMQAWFYGGCWRNAWDYGDKVDWATHWIPLPYPPVSETPK